MNEIKANFKKNIFCNFLEDRKKPIRYVFDLVPQVEQICFLLLFVCMKRSELSCSDGHGKVGHAPEYMGMYNVNVSCLKSK